jgi:rapamycin-insensitive companion of mTOR
MLVDMESIKRLNEQPFDWFLVRFVSHLHGYILAILDITRSLALDIKHTVEKEQAIKLIRTIAAIGSQKRGSTHVPCNGAVPLSERVMRAFVSVAEQLDDPFRPVAVQTLTEISMKRLPCWLLWLM